MVDPTIAPFTGAVSLKIGEDVPEESAPPLVTVAGGGTAEAEPVAVLTAGAVSLTMIVELCAPESVVGSAVGELFVVAAIVLVSEEEELELFARMCPPSQTDNTVPQELASVQRLSGLVLEASDPHCERETFQAPPSAQRTSVCHDARDIVRQLWFGRAKGRPTKDVQDARAR